MNDPKLEQRLSRFKVQDPPAVARARILTAARTAWTKAPRAGSARAWNTWRWPAYYATAATLLLLLNSVVTSLDQRWTTALIVEKAPAIDDAPTAFEQLCVELGRDPAVARRLRMLAMQPVPKGDINQLLRQKNRLLQASDLLL